MMRHTEQWTHAPGEEWRERYFVSDMGRVYSIRAHKVLSPNPILYKGEDRGYRQVYLVSGRHGTPTFARKAWLVHRLVVASFMPHLYIDGCDVHHINGNPSDNRLQNLIAVTPEEHGILHREMELARRRAFKSILDKHRRENGGEQMPLVPLVSPLALQIKGATVCERP